MSSSISLFALAHLSTYLSIYLPHARLLVFLPQFASRMEKVLSREADKEFAISQSHRAVFGRSESASRENACSFSTNVTATTRFSLNPFDKILFSCRPSSLLERRSYGFVNNSRAINNVINNELFSSLDCSASASLQHGAKTWIVPRASGKFTRVMR